jgi:ATP-dependent DNA helicase RecG
MKSSQSNTSKIDWHSPLECLFRSKTTKSLEKLKAAGFLSLFDLLWLAPLKVHILPPLQDFFHIEEGEYFKGAGKSLSTQSRPNFYARGKGRSMLQNITVVVQDIKSEKTLNLRWFNAYSSMNEKIKKLKIISFSGVVQSYQGQFQIINPEISEYAPEQENENSSFKVQYPTVNKLGPTHIKKIFDKIPKALWDEIPESLPSELLEKRGLLSLSLAMRILHAKVPVSEYSNNLLDKAKERLIYEEFFQEQIKIHLRRSKIKEVQGITIKQPSQKSELALDKFPFEFTKDQTKVLNEITSDMHSGRPMMRLIQGDVGCGKTAVAFSTAYHTCKQGFQVALMCPTESLAYQHWQNAKEIFKDDLKILYLTGGVKAKEKKLIIEELKQGEACFIIGTHALIQKDVEFPKLALSIIDEQHKFGVDQRLKLTRNQQGSHCLIMTATPIPRSLSLTQYGDLDISTIKTMPAGRKGHQTRIITPDKMSKFLSFLKTRLEMQEQAYVVVPAIEESAYMEVQNLKDTVEQFEQLFPNHNILGLHGKMKVEEKIHAFNEFKAGRVDILIATSVIEVGISVANATVLAIMGPERFGLSSLHQLRGRVGRENKPGFCFLVVDRKLPATSLERLRVIEKNTDGFKIAEEDLRIRGEGDLFGKDQSGALNARRFANILSDYATLEQVRVDLTYLAQKNQEYLGPYIKRLSQDQRIFSTV